MRMIMEEYRVFRDMYYGICETCERQVDSCEPDAREYECPYCNTNTVFGAEEALMEGIIDVTEDEE